MLCAVQLCTTWAAPERGDCVAAGLNSYVITKSRPSTGKRLIPEIIAFPFCVTSPNTVTPPLLLEALQTAGAFCFPLPQQKGQAESLAAIDLIIALNYPVPTRN